MQIHWPDWLLERGDISYIYTRVRDELDRNLEARKRSRAPWLSRDH